MERQIVIYGHADKTARGFPTAESFQHYISDGIFSEEERRYRYTQGKAADTIVLSRDGMAFGHFEIAGLVDPTDRDRDAYPPVKKVYLVQSSHSYKRPVRLSEVGIANIQFGKTLTESQFSQLLTLAGDVVEHLPAAGLGRYCRICWNTNGWTRPSGAAKETGESYVAANGFGHEEWLFNYEWCLDGYKFAFLQPVNKHRDLLEGQTISAALYTKSLGKTFLVATIHRLYVPTLAELAMAFQQMQEHGWVEQMRDDIARVGGRLSDLDAPLPQNIINVKFHPSDVDLLDPMLVFPNEHKAARMPRYQALIWSDTEQSIPVRAPSEVLTKSERLQLRAAQDPTTIDPKHSRLQNRLYEALCERHGTHAVWYEDGCVDLKVKTSEGAIFFEIKTNASAKKCIREALGQLVEYSTYPNALRSVKWIVVGDAPATSSDIAYLSHLRDMFRMPLFYTQFDWERNDIGDIL